MRNLYLVAMVAVILSVSAPAQKPVDQHPAQAAPQTPMLSAADLAAKVPPAKAEDVKSLDAIMRAVYEVISGPAGERDWKRFRSIFIPQARFTQVAKGHDGLTYVMSWSVDEFVRDADEIFSKEPFYENSIVNESQSFGNMMQVFSSYESRRAPGEKPFQRGINSMQLLNDGTRWWVISIAWDSERPDNPLPAKFTK